MANGVVAARPTVKPNEMSAAQAARAIAGGELTCEALTAACLARIADRDADVKAWAFIDKKHALEQARALDKMPRRSRLHGVPFGIKDIIDTADLPTEYNSSIYKDHRPRADAACVTLLRQAGCLIPRHQIRCGSGILPVRWGPLWYAPWHLCPVWRAPRPRCSCSSWRARAVWFLLPLGRARASRCRPAKC